ncbi:hypothetical protein MIND_00775700 [Mycena indigotica]|uniref:Up-regulated during septation protein 1 domain-containing protein n=1 Tax=Mycena indigotica TaxID=2126181 RepID=A0A8H6SLR9_9AGAR|nr:uncharacterized protein MIND_00775700 [Mycena indigotica]KAF7302090.1 hypothetical protein MIND_00775700 [Mycena indigotica]
MNGFGGGVRRFLASATGNGATSPPPGSDLPLKPGAPTWPPDSSPTISSSPPSTAALSFRKDRQDDPDSPRSPAPVQRALNGISARSQSSSPSRQLPSSLSRVANQPTRLSTSRTAIQPPSNIRDELLLSLLASEAVVDSRDFEILTSEEVEDLKKEQQDLVSRQTALAKKLTLDTKMRDAANSLNRVNAGRKNGSKQAEEQLEAANKRVETTERDLARINDRASEITKRLLEHRAGVLSYSVRSMERKMAPDSNNDSGYNTPSGTLRSPTGSSASASLSQKPRFDGAHFFAGHAETVVPSTSAKAPPAAAVLELEEKLAKATEALAVSSAKQAELARELSVARSEKEASDAQVARAEETIAALESETIDGEAHAREKTAWEEERAEWEREKMTLEEQRLEDLAQLQEETERLREVDSNALKRAQEELEDGTSALQDLVDRYNIPLYSRDPTIPVFVSTLASHLQALATKIEMLTAAQTDWENTRRKLEDDVRAGFDKRETLSREIEEARREREEARKEARAMELRVKTDIRPAALSPLPSPRDFSGDNKQLLAILQPVWAILPSPEARAAKFGTQRFRAGSGANSPSSPNPSGPPTSLSELDVRSLKTLYDPRTPSSPSPNSTASFSLDAFVQRVQALVNDDRALIERLVRFAQAHDLLKKNAERAQKLATESSTALEVYQKQVAILEERNMDLATRVSALQDEVAGLTNTIERVRKEKVDMETAAAEQAATCAQLTEANNALSAKTLALAEEAASAPEVLRKQLEETKAALATAQEDIEAMRTAEQGQSMALLEELNSLQEQNAKLRDQMRAIKK